WRVVAGVDAGAPDGWVQVRENATAGTRVRFGPDLRVRRVFDYSLGVGCRLGGRTWADLAITNTTLDGRTTPPLRRHVQRRDARARDRPPHGRRLPTIHDVDRHCEPAGLG